MKRGTKGINNNKARNIRIKENEFQYMENMATKHKIQHKAFKERGIGNIYNISSSINNNIFSLIQLL